MRGEIGMNDRWYVRKRCQPIDWHGRFIIRNIKVQLLILGIHHYLLANEYIYNVFYGLSLNSPPDMKLYSLFVAACLLIANSLCDFQNLQTDDKQLNISSPLINGVYVVNRALPCTYTPANPASK